MVIFYADDDFDDYDFFLCALAEIDPTIECLYARSGNTLMELLEYYQKPDIIILDMDLGEIDARTCLKIIKQVDALKKVPLVIYSTSPDLRDQEYCFQLGATHYFQKPKTTTEAIEALLKILKL